MKVTAVVLMLLMAVPLFAQDDRPKFDVAAAMAQDRNFELAGRAMWTASLAELAVTEYGIEASTAREANPLMQNRTVRIAAKIGTTFAVDRLTKHWRKDHPKAALWIRIATAVAWGSIAGWNFTVAF